MPQQVRAVVTRDKIVRSAAAIFDRRGYTNTSIDLIASEAGVTKGALYHHFKSKEEVANAVISLQYETAQSMTLSAVSRGETFLQKMIWMSYSFAQQMRDETVVSAGVRLTTEADARELNQEAPYDGWITAVEQLVVGAIAEGDIRDDLEPHVVAAMIIPAYTGVQLVSDIRHDRKDLFSQVEDLWTVLFIPAFVPEDRRAQALALVPEIMHSGH
jgi:AcrR family transcriptional regulator